MPAASFSGGRQQAGPCTSVGSRRGIPASRGGTIRRAPRAAELESLYCGECWKDGTVAVHLGVHHREPVHGGGEHEGGGLRRGLWRPGAPDPYLPFVRDTPPPRRLGRRLQPAAHPGGCLVVTRPVAPEQDVWGGALSARRWSASGEDGTYVGTRLIVGRNAVVAAHGAGPSVVGGERENGPELVGEAPQVGDACVDIGVWGAMERKVRLATAVSGVSERPELAPSDRFRYGERVASQQVDVLVAER